LIYYIIYFFILFVFTLFCNHLVLHSFPTRRSSDLSLPWCSPSSARLPGPEAGRLRLLPGAACRLWRRRTSGAASPPSSAATGCRSEEHTSELQSRGHLVCRLLLEKKKKVY